MPPKENPERACEECIHFFACSRQCGEQMAQRSATGCECYETVKSIAAAWLIERLTAERDALLEYAKTMQECEMCKNDSFCHFREPMEDDCQHCQRASDCPCQKCEENNCWEWRGLPEAPEEKHESV